jgi:cytochrome c5
MSRPRASFCSVLALIAGTMAVTVGSAQTVAGAAVEAAGQRAHTRFARAAAAPWCWKRVYGASCRPSARHTRKAQKKPDPRTMLIIGIGF